MDTEFILKIVPMVIALLAVVISPLISIYVTKKQLRASVNSKSRQEWINTLRDEITNYLFSFIKLEGMWFDNDQATVRNNLAEKPHSSKDLTKVLDELQKHKIKISLLINPNEDDHKKLLKILEEAYQNIRTKDKKRSEIEAEILTQSQLILKREWERVKSLD